MLTAEEIIWEKDNNDLINEVVKDTMEYMQSKNMTISEAEKVPSRLAIMMVKNSKKKSNVTAFTVFEKPSEAPEEEKENEK